MPGNVGRNRKMVNFQNVKFIKSAAREQDLIETGLPLMAVCGRSNVGKSSMINALTRRSGIAKVGAKPGKTIHVNYFDIDRKLTLADLPGYGYAAVAKSEKDRWAKLCESFFQTAKLALGILIVDARHKPTADDVTMARWYTDTGCPVIIVANKTDKVKPSELEQNFQVIGDTLNVTKAHVLPFSALKGTGRDALIGKIVSWCNV